MTIVSLTYVKTHLGITNDVEDDQLNQWIAAVTSIVEGEIKARVTSSNVTEYLSGNGTPYLFLTNRFVNSITAIRVSAGGWFGAGDNFPAETELTQGTDYVMVVDSDDGITGKSGVVRRINGVWPLETGKRVGDLVTSPMAYRGNIKATYNCGWSSIPADLQYASAVMVSMCRRTGKAGGPISGFSFEGFSKMFGASAPDDLTSIENILKKYRKWILV